MNTTSNTRSIGRVGIIGSDPQRKAITVGCYARQSVLRGDLFGSCEAQREAIEAFVKSQAGNGWVASPVRYDDGGYTGANTDRPAFQRVLADVREGKVQVVATYRLDRLSRSQRDFFQIIDELEQHGATFVSVCEQFNTTTAQGRFALSISAAVAQLEREVTSQRTRDKVHASRRRGLWTGGKPILSLDSVDGRLVVNEPEAEQVRAIFHMYLERGSLLAVLAELQRRGWTNKSWHNRRGELVTGRPFDKASLRRLLTNPLLVGKVSLGKETFAGAHDAVVTQDVFDRVRDLLKQRRRSPTKWRTKGTGALLQDLAFCRCGASLTYHYVTREPRRYGFYVCTKYQRHGAAACPGSRVAVGDLEKFVVDRIKMIGRDPALLAAALRSAREQLAAKAPDIVAEQQRLDADRRRLVAERNNLVAAVGAGGAGTTALVERLAAVEQEVAAIDARAAVLQQELHDLGDATVDEEHLREALVEFEQLFAHLSSAERGRLLHLIVERAMFNGQTNEVSITFRANGFKGLVQQPGGSK